MASTFAGNIFVLANVASTDSVMYSVPDSTAAYIKTLRIHNPSTNPTVTFRNFKFSIYS
jgi:hypothetical protein